MGVGGSCFGVPGVVVVDFVDFVDLMKSMNEDVDPVSVSLTDAASLSVGFAVAPFLGVLLAEPFFAVS